MALPLLTQMRELVWYAVDHHAALNAALAAKFRWDDSGATLSPETFAPAIGELPGLSIFGTDAATPWLTNQQQMIGYGLTCELWTPELNLRRAELIWQLFSRAIWHETTGVRRTGLIEDIVVTGPANFARVGVATDDESDVGWMIKCQWNLTLHTRWNPRTDSDSLTLS